MNEERRSLHAAFGGKEELFSRTVERYPRRSAARSGPSGTGARSLVIRAPRTIRALSLAENHSSPRQESPSALSTLTLPRMRIT